METDDTVNANDALITLIRVAEENTDIRLTLLGILNQPSFHRKSLLNTLIQEMILKGAPKNLISAMNELLNDNLADKLGEFIRKTNKKSHSGSASRSTQHFQSETFGEGYFLKQTTAA